MMTLADMTEPFPGDRMERKSGGGCLTVFGLPFLAAGLFMLLIALGVSGVPMDGDLPPVVLALMGIVFTGVGTALMFGRAGITIDRTAMKVTKWWGLLVPFGKREYDLASFDRITVEGVALDEARPVAA